MSCRGSGGLVIVEEDHGEDPVAITQVPDNPLERVGAKDDGQHKEVDNDQDGASEENHQRYKYLEERNEEEDRRKKRLENWGCSVYS